MYKLIIADDDEILLSGLSSAFDWAALDIEVEGVVTSGEDALLEIERHGRYDILLTDIKMGRMDGLQLTQEVRLRYPAVRVVIMSAYEDFRFAQQAVRMNVVDYLVKPIDLVMLESTMRRITAALEHDRMREAHERGISSRMEEIGERAAEEYYRAAGALNTAIVEYLAQITLLGNVEDVPNVIMRLSQNMREVSGGSFVFMVAVLGILIARLDSDQLSERHRASLLEMRRHVIASHTLDQALEYMKTCLTDIAGTIAEQMSLGGEQSIRQACRYIDENFSNPALRIRDVAASVGFSQSYLSALFSRHVGESFTDYLIRRRMEHAQQLLLNTDLKSYEIAYKAGYDNPTYFSSLFKRYTGMTMSQFRNAIRPLC